MIVRDRPSGIRLFFVVKGSIFPKIIGVLSANVAISIGVTALHGSVFDHKITLTPIPFSLIGLALAIFLGFRNNAAYDRYWEGRKLWAQMASAARNLTRQTQGFISGSTAQVDQAPDMQDVRTRIVYRAIAYAHTLRHMLRGIDHPEELKPFLRDSDWNELKRAPENLNILMLQMGRDLRLCLDNRRIDPPTASALDATFSQMVTVATSCERIKNTPVPFSYSLLLHRTAYLYCFLLPFGLVDTTGFMTPLVVGIVAYTFFGLDVLGDEIEEPFGTSDNDLPLDAICRSIEIELRKAVGDSTVPAHLQPTEFSLT